MRRLAIVTLLTLCGLAAQDRAAWMRDGKFGVMTHYLADWISQTTNQPMTIERWNALVDGFDVERMGEQLKSVGAAYYIISIGQNSGYYLSPNAVYDKLTGVTPSKLSKRDLVADLYEALHKRGIKLMVYLPSGAPGRDKEAIAALEWKNGPHRNREFQQKWEQIIREWSMRWGSKVEGWWFDGCYWPNTMYRTTDAPNFASFAAAVRAGNPNAAVAFNPGVIHRLISITPYEDYIAGEIDDPDKISIRRAVDGKQDGAQLQVLTHLGEQWGKGAPRYSAEQAVAWSGKVWKEGGSITWDTPVDPTGTISPAFLEQLRAIGRAAAAKAALSFEPNAGQAAAKVRYLARGGAYELYLNSAEIVVAGRHGAPLRTKLAGANLAARVTGEELQGSHSNYFVGSDPSKWHEAVPNYGRVRYSGVYPGIDLVYYGKDGVLEYDWIVGPGADPRQIRMVFTGAERPRIDASGDLVAGDYRHKRPALYQEIAGKRVAVAGRWALHGNEGSFAIGSYDREKALVIDPPLTYSTYYGGSGLDYAFALAVDSIGNTYVTGGVGSTTVQGSSVGLKGVEDVFVTKLNPSGGKMYTTYIGGNNVDEGHGIAVDVQGNAYITGSTGSLDFPLKNALQTKQGGSGDAFVVKLNATGTMVYSTYLGGNGIDTGSGIALDSSGNAYIVGSTFSTDLPVVNAFQQSRGAQQDAFIAKINATGTAWVYVTYLGGNNVDQGNGIAVDAAGNAYVTGYTQSTNFPTQSAIRGSNAGSVDAFITKLNPAGSALVYSTYLGGTGLDYGTAIAVDSSGNAYVTGITGSDDFPLASPIDNLLGSHAVDDAFVAKLNPAGSALVYSTYLGGGSADDPYAIAIDAAGNVYVTGRTNSSDFPLNNAIQITRTAFDMFVTEINAAGSARLFSTFIGGSGEDVAHGIAVDYLGNIHVAGETTSTDFPMVNPLQGTFGGGGVAQDGVVLLLGTAPPSKGPVITSVSDNLVDGGPVVPGGWFYVKGTDLSDVTRIWGGSDFSDPTTLPTNLNGVEVWVNGAPVPVYFISPGQVNAQAPSNISGSMTVQVFRLGLGSNILTAPVAQIAPSLYFYSAGQKNYAAALFQDYTIMGDPAVVPGTRKATSGDIIQLYAAGLGPSSSGAVTSPVPISGVTVNVGSASASVLGAYLVAPGQFQVNFTVPNLAAGEYSITVSSNGKTSQANVLFEVQ